MSMSAESRQAYDSLHPDVQRWVYDQGWPDLRPIQAMAIPPILAGDRDVLITAGTAGGKTEAAWLPILSRIARSIDDGTARTGVKALMLSPLKALINDQGRRLEEMTRALEIPVRRRHSDVSGRERDALKSAPDGVMLMTPESLEALFVLDGHAVPEILHGLQYIVVDELHAFIGSERGAQVQSLMHRIELAIRRVVPRVALSATIADTSIAAAFLRPERPEGVEVLAAPAGSGTDLQLMLRGYVDPSDAKEQNGPLPSQLAIVDHVFTYLRGTNNLVFANSRNAVETYTAILTQKCEDERVPNEFLAHHGSLARDHREDIERRLKSGTMPTTAICTSTLEMGIDIGSVTSIGQIGSPGGVAALRQRLGRSGRRGNPATLRVYIAEREPASAADIVKTDGEIPHPEDGLFLDLVEAIAILELLLEHWLEPPNADNLHMSTLVQQILSVMAQHGGARADQVYGALCGHGPFRLVTPAMFATLLRDLGARETIMQDSSGLLLPGAEGERTVNRYEFYTAFTTQDAFRVEAGGRLLGTMALDQSPQIGQSLVFGGRGWRITNVRDVEKIIEVVAAGSAGEARFSGERPAIADGIRARMRDVLAGTDMPTYLNETAADLLRRAREAFAAHRLAENPIVTRGSQAVLFPWAGDRVLTTLQVMLSNAGERVERERVSLTIDGANPGHIKRILRRIADGDAPDGAALAAFLPMRCRDRYDTLLGEELLNAQSASRDLDVAGAMAAIRRIVSEDQAADRP